MLGVNQTILFALSMVVIAGLIGGGGLGAVVTSGLYTNPGLAVLGGVAIVIMAMALDRATEAIADRTDPAKRHLDEAGKRRLRLQTARRRRRRSPRRSRSRSSSARRRSTPTRSAPTSRRRRSRSGFSAAIQSVLDFVQNPESWVFGITEPTGNNILTHVLLPIQSFLVEAPWFTTRRRAGADRARRLRSPPGADDACDARA